MTHSNNFNVNSKHFIDKILVDIIQLTKTLAIEYKIKPDPDAKIMAREIVQAQLNTLMTNENKDLVNKIVKRTYERLKKNPTEDDREIKELLNIMLLL